MTASKKREVRFWSPIEIASASTQSLGYTLVESVNQSSASSQSNYRAVKFAALQEALHSVSKLDEDDAFHLDSFVCARASDLLGAISANLTIAPPRFFPQDGEVATFTWDTPSVKRLLSVEVDDVDILDINKLTYVKCAHEGPQHIDEQVTFILRELGAENSASNSSMGIDA
ncbi:hypothetical protein [Agrobacterium pusense]|uniref:hypothetical protein n=1 Tax=Agrobacterium pusense TaxID=648995 RepID=UPI003FD61411